MKTMLKTGVSLLLALLLLLGAMPALALYDWDDPAVTDTWSRITEKDDITATNILEPVNPNASQEAKNLYAYLCKLTDTQTFLNGQFDIQNTDSIWERTKEQLGVEPALYSCRYLVDVSVPVFDANEPTKVINTSMDFQEVEEANELLLRHYEKGNVLLVHSDSAPRSLCADLAVRKGLYDDNANVVIELDKTNPDRDLQVYSLWIKYQDQVIAALQALEDSGVKAYMWRPWIEFNYSNFNGVTEEGYVAFTRVFQQTVQMLIDAGLTGFLVTYSPGQSNNTIKRNPGNEYVDVYSVTLYSQADLLGAVPGPNCQNYDWYVKTGKPIGFSEYSSRAGSVVVCQSQARASWYTLLQSTVSNFPRVSWVNGWADSRYAMLNNPQAPEEGNDDGMAYVSSPFTLNLEDVPDYRQGVIQVPGVAQLFLKGEGTYRPLEEKTYTAADLKKLGIDLSKLNDLRLNEGYSITFYSEDNADGEKWGYAEAARNLSQNTTKQFRSLTVSSCQNVALSGYGYDEEESDSAGKVNDGMATMWESKVDPKTGSTWVAIELPELATVTGYVVKTAGYSGRLDMYNVRDFQLQYSEDGNKWVTVDTVTGNTAGQLSRSIIAVTARYFRLLVTGGNSSVLENQRDEVCIAELELMGIYLGNRTENKPDDSSQTTEPMPVVSTDETPGDDPVYSEPGDEITEPGGEEEPDEPDAPQEEQKAPEKNRVVHYVTMEYFPWWGFVLIGAGVLLAAGVAVWIILAVKRRKKQEVKEQAEE